MNKLLKNNTAPCINPNNDTHSLFQKKDNTSSNIKRTTNKNNIQTTSGITHISLPNNSKHAFNSMIMPMLAHLSHNSNNRWLTWVTQQPLSKSLLKNFNFDLNKVRIINPSNENDILWLTWDALNSGNSSTVVIDIDKINVESLKHLESASFNGHCRGLIFTTHQDK